MAERKNYYIVTEVAALLGCSTGYVYEALREGKLKGHKCSSGKWLIPIDQESVFAALVVSSNEVPDNDVAPHKSESFIRYIADSEHYTEVFGRMNQVKHSLKLASGDLKNFNVYFSADKDAEPIKFCDFLLLLLKRGITVQIVCMKPFGFYNKCKEELPELLEQNNLEIRQCDHNHMKVFIFDDECVYIGSANLTGAAIGRRASNARNHEAGILAQNNEIFSQAASHFAKVWDDPDNLKSTWHRFAKKSKELQNKYSK